MTEAERLRAALAEIRILANDLLSNRTVEIAVIADTALEQPQPIPDTRPKLTDQQAAVLSYIRESIARKSYSPSFREVQDAFGFKSPNGVVCHLHALREKGYLRWSPDTARSFVPLEAS